MNSTKTVFRSLLAKLQGDAPKSTVLAKAKEATSNLRMEEALKKEALKGLQEETREALKRQEELRQAKTSYIQAQKDLEKVGQQLEAQASRLSKAEAGEYELERQLEEMLFGGVPREVVEESEPVEVDPVTTEAAAAVEVVMAQPKPAPFFDGTTLEQLTPEQRIALQD